LFKLQKLKKFGWKPERPEENHPPEVHRSNTGLGYPEQTDWCVEMLVGLQD
jgi:hypothetical protein